MPDRKKVFVVYGRNEEARRAVFDFLRSIALTPIEWSQAVAGTGSATPFIGQVLDYAFSEAQAVVVLLTPDDVAYLHEKFRMPTDPDYEANPMLQARPNVLFEAGVAMGRNPERTVLVAFPNLGKLRPFSDIGGRYILQLDHSMQKRQDLALRLQSANCDVNLAGTDWHTAGQFDKLQAVDLP